MGIPDDMGRNETHCRICCCKLDHTIDPTMPAARCKRLAACRADHCCVECCKHDAGSTETWEDMRLRDVLRIGDHVMHQGTKDWGTIKVIDHRNDGSAELVLTRTPRLQGHSCSVDAFWATYHLGAIELDDNDPRLLRLSNALRIYRRHEAGGQWPAPPRRT